MFDKLRDAGFDVLVKNHAAAILSVDFPNETKELVDALLSFRLPVSELISSGGGEAASTQRLRKSFSDKKWHKHNFQIETKIDGMIKEATSHEIDHIKTIDKGTIALEIEWNNKDPFFDRDLENFQRLHAQSVISAGVVVTRGQELQSSLLHLVTNFLRAHNVEAEEQLRKYRMKDRTERQRAAVRRNMEEGFDFPSSFAKPFVSDKFGVSTTHWNKLTDRIDRGVGNPCPLLLIGLPKNAVDLD